MRGSSGTAGRHSLAIFGRQWQPVGAMLRRRGGDAGRRRSPAATHRQPRQAAASGESSGRQRRHGLNPASCAAAALGKKVQFSDFAVRAGQMGRQ